MRLNLRERALILMGRAVPRESLDTQVPVTRRVS